MTPKQTLSLSIVQWVQIKQSLSIVNYMFGFLGLIGVWMVTHSWLALLLTLIASIHVSLPEKWIKEYQESTK